MPFTLAHPAAVVPIWRVLGRRLSLSAFVIGSMVPDVPFFAGHGGFRYQTHSVVGLFTFCLPVGFFAWLLFQGLMKRPLLWLLPSRAREALDDSSAKPARAWSMRTLIGAAMALLLGSVTHVIWDAVTHIDGFGVIRFPSLRTLLFVVDGYHVYVYKVLQHGSTWLGFTLLAWWLLKWWRGLPPVNVASSVGERRMRTLVYALFIFAPMVYGVVSALPAFKGATWALSLQAYSAVVAREMGALVVLALVTYAAMWYAVRARRQGKMGKC